MEDKKETVKEKAKKTGKNAVMSVKRMSVILWCVTAIVLIVWLNLFYAQVTEEGCTLQIPQYITVTAMSLIAAMGGVDVWKNRPKAP